MAIVNFCGFETGDVLSELNYAQPSNQTTDVSFVTSPTIGSWSNYALKAESSVSGYVFLGRVSPQYGYSDGDSVQTAYAKFNFRVGQFPTGVFTDMEVFAAFLSGGLTSFTLAITDDGYVAYYGGNLLSHVSTKQLELNTWYMIELKCRIPTSGFETNDWEVRVDGQTVLSGAVLGNINTGNSPISGIALGRVGNIGNGYTVYYYDDVAWSNSDWVGQCRCKVLPAVANGTYQTWSIGAGSGSHYQVADDIPPNGNTDYLLSSSNIGDAETFQVQTGTNAGIDGAVLAVKSIATVKKDGTDPGAIRGRLRSNGTNSDTANDYENNNILSEWHACQKYALTDPATGQPWQLSALDTLEAGAIERSSDTSKKTRLTFAGVSVLYNSPKMDASGGLRLSGTATAYGPVAREGTGHIRLSGSATYAKLLTPKVNAFDYFRYAEFTNFMENALDTGTFDYWNAEELFPARTVGADEEAPASYSYTMTGGLYLSGYALVPIEVSASGGLRLSGRTAAASGGSGGSSFDHWLRLEMPPYMSGASSTTPFDYFSRAETYPGMHVVSAGSTEILDKVTLYWTGTGGLRLSNEATFRPTYRYTIVTGGLRLSNSATYAPTYRHNNPTGGLRLSGDAVETPVLSATMTGSLRLSGDAVETLTLPATMTGGLRLSNSADYTPPSFSYSYSASGDLRLSGDAVETLTLPVTMTGGLRLSNSADGRPSYAYTCTGYIRTGSTAYNFAIHHYLRARFTQIDNNPQCPCLGSGYVAVFTRTTATTSSVVWTWSAPSINNCGGPYTVQLTMSESVAQGWELLLNGDEVAYYNSFGQDYPYFNRYFQTDEHPDLCDLEPFIIIVDNVVAHVHDASGGLRLSGDAVEAPNYALQTSGVLRFSNSANVALTLPVTMTGGLRLSNSADYAPPTFSYSYTATGRIRLGDVSLLLHWKFDEGSGTLIVDSSIYDRHGTRSFGTYVSGSPLNYTNQYAARVPVIDGPNVPVSGLASGTLSIWIKVDVGAFLTDGVILDPASTGDANFALLGGDPHHVTGRLETQNESVAVTTSDIDDGIWHHICCVYDGSTLRILVDGILHDSKPATGNIVSDSGTSAIALSSHESSVDDARIYSVALSDQDIKLLARGYDLTYARTSFTLPYTSSGGLRLSNTASTLQSHSYQASGVVRLSNSANYNNQVDYSATGGLRLSGDATETLTLPYTMSGGLRLSNSATLAQSYVYAASGVLRLSGTVEATAQTSYSYAASGGVRFSNAAAFVPTYLVTATGGLFLANSTTVQVYYSSYTPTGGLRLSNSAGVSTQSSYFYEASGNLKLSNGADFRPTYLYAAAGRVVLGDTSPFTQTIPCLASGGLRFSNSANTQQTTAAEATGGLRLSGDAVETLTLPYLASGELRLSGDASETFTQPVSSTGGLRLSGDALESVTLPFDASGVLRLSGTAETTAQTSYSYTPTGGLRLSGDSTEVITLAYTMTGGLRLSGDAVETLTLPYTMSGGLRLSGIGTGTQTSGSEGAGGLRLSGDAVETLTLPYTMTGGLRLSGDAVETSSQGFDPIGGLRLSGDAVESLTLPSAMSGGLRLSGDAVETLTLSYTMSGGLRLSGSADAFTLSSYDHTGTGGLRLSGDALETITIPYVASGGLRLSGDATEVMTLPSAMTGGLRLNGSCNVSLSLYCEASGVVRVLGRSPNESGSINSPNHFDYWLRLEQPPFMFGTDATTAFDYFNRNEVYSGQINAASPAGPLDTIILRFTASGGLILSGTAEASQQLVGYTASGNIRFIRGRRIGANTQSLTHFKFDTGSGAAIDSSGNNRDGHVTGSSTYTTTTAPLQYANPYALSTPEVYGHELPIHNTYSCALCGWWKIPVGANLNENTFLAATFNYALAGSAETGVLKGLLSGAQGGNVQVSGVDDNQWHHYCLNYDGAFLKLYFDGVLVDSDPATGPITVITGSILGHCHIDSAVGIVDDFRVYGFALSEEQIETLADGRELEEQTEVMADVTIIIPFLASGVVRLSGTPTLRPTYLYQASGGLRLSNSADTLSAQGGVGSGNLKLSGSAIVSNVSVAVIADGGLRLSGDAVELPIIRFEASGGLRLSNSATYSPTYPFVPQGRMSIGPRTGYSLRFTSSPKTEVNITDRPELRLSTFTVSTWVKPTATGQNANNVIISKGGTAIANYNYLLYYSNNNIPRAGFNAGTVVNATTSLSANTWHHVAATYDGSQLAIYVNGILENSINVTETVVTGSMPLEFGSSDNNFYNSDGNLDEIRIYNVGLSSSEIRRLAYNVDVPTSGLVVYYKFEEGVGTTTVDNNGTVNTGTLINSPAWMEDEAIPVAKARYTSATVTIPYTASGGITLSGRTGAASNIGLNGFDYFLRGEFVNIMSSQVTTGFDYFMRGEEFPGMIYQTGTGGPLDTITLPYTGSGLIQFSNEALVIPAVYLLATGALRFSNGSTQTITLYYTSSGGLRLSGDAVETSSQGFDATGGLRLSGDAVETLTLPFTMTDGLRLSGDAVESLTIPYTASGGLRLSGDAVETSSQGFDPTGGLRLSGDATETLTLPYTATGGLRLSGDAVESLTLPDTMTGGLRLSGSAIADFSNSYFYTATGGLFLSGDAVETLTIPYTASGGLRLSGDALETLTQPTTATGGLRLSGDAVETSSQPFTMTGGLFFSNSADYRPTYIYNIVTGGLFLSGTGNTGNLTSYGATGYLVFSNGADYKPTYIYNIVAGGLFLSGDATETLIDSATGTGGLRFSNAADATSTQQTTATGGLFLSGDAIETLTIPYTASGGLRLSGDAVESSTQPQEGTGGLRLSGDAVESLTLPYTMTGGLRLSGTGTGAQTSGGEGTGGLRLSGDADETLTIPYTATGGLRLSGDADETLILGATATGGLRISGSYESVYITFPFAAEGALYITGRPPNFGGGPSVNAIDYWLRGEFVPYMMG